jgi:hypothetical protein
MKKFLSFLKKFHLFHSWEVHRNTGIWEYLECSVCKQRKIVRVNDAWQPRDLSWLSGGEFDDNIMVTLPHFKNTSWMKG